MTLPGVSPFILSSINSVVANFVAPKSYEIDMSRFFLGSDVIMRELHMYVSQGATLTTIGI